MINKQTNKKDPLRLQKVLFALFAGMYRILYADIRQHMGP